MPRTKPATWSMAEWRAYRARVARRARVAQAPKPLKVEVGVMVASVSPGKDGKLGTQDDKVTIKPKKVMPKKKAAPKKAPLFNKDMTKAELIAVAGKMQVKGLTMKKTKAEILTALKKSSK